MIYNEGKEYTTDAPNTSLVELLRADRARQTSSYTALPRSESEHIDSKSLHALSGIIGPDNRVVRRDNTAYPMSTVTYLALPGGSYSGSGTMIGPSTALTAAHVVHNGTNWLRSPPSRPVPTARTRPRCRSAATAATT